MKVDQRLKQISKTCYLHLFADWNATSRARLHKQLNDVRTIGGICFEVIDRRSTWYGLRAHLPVGPSWTLKSFSDVFTAEADNRGRPLLHGGCAKYPIYAYRVPVTAEDRFWESSFDRHWWQYFELDGQTRPAVSNTIMATTLDMVQYHCRQLPAAASTANSAGEK